MWHGVVHNYFKSFKYTQFTWFTESGRSQMDGMKQHMNLDSVTEEI